jgi:hypothetical protein
MTPSLDEWAPWAASGPQASTRPDAGRCDSLINAVRMVGGLERVRRKLAGVADGDRQMVSILTTVLSDGLSAVESACLEALREDVHFAHVIINILASAGGVSIASRARNGRSIATPRARPAEAAPRKRGSFRQRRYGCREGVNGVGHSRRHNGGRIGRQVPLWALWRGALGWDIGADNVLVVLLPPSFLPGHQPSR